jgi:molybdenum cofactor synthesis domain-containing protein
LESNVIFEGSVEMRRESKISGLRNERRDEWYKLVYVHNNSNGGTCVNGSECLISLKKAGGIPEDGTDFSIILPPGLEYPEGHFLSINSGETVLRAGENSRAAVVCPGFIGVSSTAEVMRPILAGVLTVSDKGSRGEREDTAGPALADLVSSVGCVVEKRRVVPDDRETISEILREWADNLGLHLIITTGGTGLSPRDVTPEALMDISEKTAPGFGEIMRAHAMRYTSRGFLSRGLAVTRGKTLIIAFPGSERGVKQCFEAIAPALRHGVEILNGWDSECGGH